MGQSELLAASLAGGFLLYLAMNNRLAAYWALLTGGAPAAAPAATPASAAASAATSARGLAGGAVGAPLSQITNSAPAPVADFLSSVPAVRRLLGPCRSSS